MSALLHLLRRLVKDTFRGRVHRAAGPDPGALLPAPPDMKQQISLLTESHIPVRFSASFQPLSPYSSLDMKA